jgi:hypothetical protein
MAGTGPKRRDTSFGLRYVFLLSYLFNLLLTTIIISTIYIKGLSMTMTLQKPTTTNKATQAPNIFSVSLFALLTLSTCV